MRLFEKGGCLKYPNGFFKPKRCKQCSTEFVPDAPSRLYCNPECARGNAYYKRVYGITRDDVEGLHADQSGLCYLCGGEGFVMGRYGRAKLVVDHCHSSGAVRRLLCHNCNRGLGLFQDDPEVLRRAAMYIEAYR